METQKLPSNPQEAIAVLTQQVNRLNGRVAALMAVVKAMGFEFDPPPVEELEASAAERAQIIFYPAESNPPGPGAATEASLALADLLAKKP